MPRVFTKKPLYRPWTTYNTLQSSLAFHQLTCLVKEPKPLGKLENKASAQKEIFFAAGLTWFGMPNYWRNHTNNGAHGMRNPIPSRSFLGRIQRGSK
jgi:hypothetical protein